MKFGLKQTLIFGSALLLVSIFLFIRVIQYEPLFPNRDGGEKSSGSSQQITIPIYEEDPIIGDKKAGITVIAFEDFGCAACEQASTILDELIKEYPKKIKVIWKGLPVTEFPYPSEDANLYGFCAYQQQKFNEYKNFAFTNGNNLSPIILNIIAEEIELNKSKLGECLNSIEATRYIEQTKQLAQILNIQSVPTFFVDNKQIQNPGSIEGWKILLNI